MMPRPVLHNLTIAARTPSRTTTDSPSEPGMRINYEILGPPLGAGSFGTVYKCINVVSRKHMAVKILEQPASASKQVEWAATLYYAWEREVKKLSQLSHAHIVEYITSQGWKGPRVEIFMGLKDGTLKSLLGHEDCVRVAELVFPQMLEALDYLACANLVHRDVKPENILYTGHQSGGYHFQLGDFGLCNDTAYAASAVGTKLYMAPEVWQCGRQSAKVDVWSLFVTMLWTLNAGNFRLASESFQSSWAVLHAVLAAASNIEQVSVIKEMAIEDPRRRASAAQMLIKHYNGAGLTTPRNQITALTGGFPTAFVTRTSTTALPFPRTRVAQVRAR